MTEITLNRIEGLKFEAENAQGYKAILDGPAKMGGSEEGVRPMEMVLMGLAGCSSFDVLHILQKSRQQVEDLKVKVQAERSDEIPAVFTDIHLEFIVSGEVAEKQLQRAIDLSVDKYCSVATMLRSTATIKTSYQII